MFGLQHNTIAYFHKGNHSCKLIVNYILYSSYISCETVLSRTEVIPKAGLMDPIPSVRRHDENADGLSPFPFSEVGDTFPREWSRCNGP